MVMLNGYVQQDVNTVQDVVANLLPWWGLCDQPLHIWTEIAA